MDPRACCTLFALLPVALLLAGCADSSGPTATPTPLPQATARPTQSPAASATDALQAIETPTTSVVQELALLENYAATSFFPDTTIVRQGVPVKLYFTRLHREHVNRFSIEPFFSTSDVVLPGEVAVFEFLPDQLGEYRILNEGHGFDSTLIVVADEQAEAAVWAQQRGQEVALIFSADASRIMPQQVTVQRDVPVTVYILALDREHQVSVPPFYSPSAANVSPMEIESFEFTATESGTYAIVDELTGLEVTLIVR